MKIRFPNAAGVAPFLLAACVCGLGACSISNSRSAGANRRGSDQELEQARLQLAEYRKRFGPLATTKPEHSLRDLQSTLPGKSLKEVALLLGKPGGVYLSGHRECWDYYGVCYAPITGRTVGKLGIWFEKGKVERLDSVF
jgi:hypothetical protein